jgi:RNA polymerase sigma-32 factor
MAAYDNAESQRANRRFINRTMSLPLLSRERELELARAWRDKGDEAALHELIMAYARIVVSTASKFRHYGLPMGDLVQEGNVGMMQAAARFEPDRGVRFSTYASWWIRSAMQDFILRNWSIVRTGTTAAQKSLFFNLRRLRAKIASASAAQLTPDQRDKIATQLKVNAGDVADMEARLAAADQSLNAPLTQDSDGDWQDFLADERPSPEEVVTGMRDAETRSAWLNRALSELSDREQKIIRERRLTEETVTLEELGKELGVSKERVRQIEHRALQKLRHSMEQMVTDSADLLLD